MVSLPGRGSACVGRSATDKALPSPIARYSCDPSRSPAGGCRPGRRRGPSSWCADVEPILRAAPVPKSRGSGPGSPVGKGCLMIERNARIPVTEECLGAGVT